MRGITIVAVIHQPSYEMISQFDLMYVISARGTCIYSDSPRNLKTSLRENYSIVWQSEANQPHEGAILQEYVNPVDIVIHVASLRKRDDPEATKFRFWESVRQIWGYLKTWFRKANEEEEAPIEPPLDLRFPAITTIGIEAAEEDIRRHYLELNNNPDIKLHNKIQRNNNACNCCNCCTNLASIVFLFARCVQNEIFRNKAAVIMQALMYVILGGILCSLYDHDVGKALDCATFVPAVDPMNCSCYGPSSNDSSSSQHETAMNNVRFQFFSILFQMFAALMPTVLSFPSEIRVFLSEQYNGWYSTTHYYIAKTLSASILLLICPYFFIAILYYRTGQVGSDTLWNVLPFTSSYRFSEYFW